MNGMACGSRGGTVYRVKAWSEVYETADSRKHKSLQWVSIPIGFDSDGFVRLVEEFGEEAPAIYGAWIALVLVAARCPIRGVLSTSNGDPISEGRLAFVSHFPGTVFGKLIDWASRIGWLEAMSSDDVRLAIERQQKRVGLGVSDGQSIGDRSAIELPNKPNPTQPNQTLPNPTQQTVPSVVVGGGGGELVVRVLSKSDFESVPSDAVERLADALGPVALRFSLEKPKRGRLARVALAAGVRAELLSLVRACGASTTRDPMRYWAGGLAKIFNEAGVDLDGSLAELDGLIASQKTRKVRAV
jgi:hypothetical protein